MHQVRPVLTWCFNSDLQLRKPAGFGPPRHSGCVSPPPERQRLSLTVGLYQIADADYTAEHSLAEAALRVPSGVVCLVSALAHHGLTDQIPSKVWMAIGHKAWASTTSSPPLRIVRFADNFLADGVDTVLIEDVGIRIFGVAKTIADSFRHRRSVGLAVALEGLQEALRQRKASPSEILIAAEHGRVGTIVRPYLSAMTANG